MDNIERSLFIEIYWSVVSQAHFMTNYILIFKSTSYHSVDADGFGVCFKMGKKRVKVL